MPADARRVELYLVEEATWGEVVGVPKLMELRASGESLVHRMERIDSREIQPDRMLRSLARVQSFVRGGIDMEVSAAALDGLLAGAFMAEWSGAVLVNGATKKSFAVEKHFADVGAYQLCRGLMVDTMRLSVGAREWVQASFGFLGRDVLSGAATVGDGSPTAAPTGAVLSGAKDVGTITEGGAPLSGVYLQAVSLQLANNLRPVAAVGFEQLVDIALGRLDVTGEVTAFFEDFALYDKYLAGQETSLSFSLRDAGGAGYDITLPRVVYTGAQGPMARASDRDVMVRLDFTALRDPSTQTVIRIDA